MTSEGGSFPPKQSQPLLQYGVPAAVAGQSPQSVPEQPQVRRLSAEEMRAFRECNRESFYYRSLPFSVLGMLGVRYLGSIGYLKPSPVYGMYMKYTGAVVLGYFIGKFSYLGKCRQKIMSLPNSELAEALKKSYGGGKRQFEVLQEMVTLPEIPKSGTGTADQGYAPIGEGSDMYTNPDFSVANDRNAQRDQTPQKQSTTYDDLRRKNREDYLRQQFGVQPVMPQQQPTQQQRPEHYHSQPSVPAPAQEASPPPRSRFSYGPPSQPAATTKYGDVDFK